VTSEKKSQNIEMIDDFPALKIRRWAGVISPGVLFLALGEELCSESSV
jgi:hypothetical protein